MASVQYKIAAAGDKEGTIFFDNSDLFGGLASEEPFEASNIEVPMTTVDLEVDRLKLPLPYLIKMDTHGFEVPILKGAEKTLKETQLVIMETYNYRLTPKSLKFYEMAAHMEQLGFFPIEMVDFALRKYDRSFWQMDTFYLASDNPAFAYDAYL